MSSLGSPNPFFIAGKKAYEIERSLRFNDDDGAYLQETAGTPTNNKIWTYSVWVKRTTLSGDQAILVGYSNGGSFDQILFSSSGGRDNQLFMQFNNSGTYGQFTSTRLFRDVGAWGHLVIKADTTAGSNGVTVYWNNEVVAGTWNVTLAQDATFHSLNQSGDIFRIGHLASGVANHYLDGYLAEINFVDGSALLPSSFGATDPITGQWNPRKYTGSYGTNGFYLNFSTDTLGTDRSGNSNDFTPNNFSVVAGEGNDALSDSPTNNFCNINTLDTYRSGNTLAEGNLKLTRSSGNFGNARGSFAVNSGKWYYEWKCTGQHTQVGWVNTGFDINYNSGDVSVTSSGGNGVGMYLDSRGFMYGWQDSGGNTYFPSSSSYVSYTTGDIIMVAFDVDNFKFWFGKNGSWTNVTGTADPSSGTDGVSPVASKNDGTYVSGMFFQPLLSCFSGGNGHVNFGQRPFSYTIPTGYKKLNSANLPNPTIKLPNKHFNTVLYTGNNNTSQNITGVGFSPDWVWVKNRDNVERHHLVDSVRGDNKVLHSEYTDGERTGSHGSGHTQLNLASDGFNLVSNGSNDELNFGTRTYVAWNWNAGDTDGKTYTVKVVSDSGNKYRFDDFGTSAVTLDLAEGGTYTFDQSDSSMSSHPMQLSTTANGTHGGGSAYSTGVTYELDGSTVTASAFISGFSSASSRKLIITVAASAPTLYYYCYYHSGMGGQANTNSTLGSSNFDGSKQTVVKANASAGFSIISYTGDGSSGATTGHGLGVAPKIMFHKNRDGANNWYTITTAIDGSADYLYLNTTASALNSSVTAPTSSLVYFTASTESNANGTDYIMYAFSEVAGYSKFGSYTGNGSSDGTFVFTGFRPALIIIKRTDSSSGANWLLLDNKRNTFNVVNKNLFANLSNANADTDRCDFLANGFKFRQSGTTVNTSSGTYIYLAFAESPFKNARAR